MNIQTPLIEDILMCARIEGALASLCAETQTVGCDALLKPELINQCTVRIQAITQLLIGDDARQQLSSSQMLALESIASALKHMYADPNIDLGSLEGHGYDALVQLMFDILDVDNDLTLDIMVSNMEASNAEINNIYWNDAVGRIKEAIAMENVGLNPRV